MRRPQGSARGRERGVRATCGARACRRASLLSALLPALMLPVLGGRGARAAETTGSAGVAVSSPRPADASRVQSSACAQDDQVPTPPGWSGWDRTAVVAWEAIEQSGGIVPDIEEDRTQAPPRWWRYPSPVRSLALLEAEASAPQGLYTRVPAAEVAKGDLLVRVRGAGVCGKMGVIGGEVEGQWVTIEVDPDGRGPSMRPGSPLFFAADGRTLLPDVHAFRIRVKKEETLGHLRELARDLEHLERTVADRPPLVAQGSGGESRGKEAVDEKVHELLDEAWSLTADEKLDVDRRELAARALALAAALGWPAAAEAAAGVLDDVLKRAPARPWALVTRATTALLQGQADRAIAWAEGARGSAGSPPRAELVLARAYRAAGRLAEADAALARFLVRDPLDHRGKLLKAEWSKAARVKAAGARGAAPPSDAPPVAKSSEAAPSQSAPLPAGARFFGSRDSAGLDSEELGFSVSWPMTWRVLAINGDGAGGLLVNLATGRALSDDGAAERAGAVLLVQRAAQGPARAALARDGVRKLFPTARVKSLKPLVPGSKRQHFRERQPGDGGPREGEVTTVERGEMVAFLVLNAPAKVYGKLREEYAAFARSLTAKPAPAPAAIP